ASIPLCILIARAPAVLEPRGRTLLLAVLGCALAGPLLLQLAASVGIHPRYFAAMLPPLLVLIAVAAAGGGHRMRICAFALLAVMAFGTARHLALPGYGREDTRAATAWLNAHAAPDEPILVTSIEMAHLARFFWPTRSVQLYPPNKVVVARADAPQW